MKIFSGKLLLEKNNKIAIIVSKFNSSITENLLEGCVDAIKKTSTNDILIDVFYVPGSFEIPLIAKKLAIQKKYNAIVCLGCVIRGETSHYDYVCSETSKGISNVMIESQIPIIFGILTTETMEQAIDRSGGKMGNKGYECGLNAIEMINLINQIDKNKL